MIIKVFHVAKCNRRAVGSELCAPKKEGAGATAPAFHMKKIVCIESEVTHYFLGGPCLSDKQGNLTSKSGMKKSFMKNFTCWL